MAKITVLPPALASQIAAGEVVERPASATKELIENALDAKATRCDVSCSGGGIEELSVRDDGIGMTAEDAALCVERHATSKLTQISDLGALTTFGFRGEALPSIASVSRFTLRTRSKESDHGCCVEILGGKPASIRREGMPVGTTVLVKDLFFNVPARRKFLRSTGTESAHITAAVEGAALSRPDVTFTLERDGRKVRELLRTSTRRERVMQLLPEESLTEVLGERGPVRLEAHLSRPERARPGATGLWLLVNGRVIRDRMLSTTVAQAYGGTLSSGSYPRGVVYLDIPSELVDVNVHPQKTEVRFVDPRATSDAVYSIVSRAVSAAFALPLATRGARYQASHAASPKAVDLLPIERGFLHNRNRDALAIKEIDPWGLGRSEAARSDATVEAHVGSSEERTQPEEQHRVQNPPVGRVPAQNRQPRDLVVEEPAPRLATTNARPIIERSTSEVPPCSDSAPSGISSTARRVDAAQDLDEPAPATMLNPTLEMLEAVREHADTVQSTRRAAGSRDKPNDSCSLRFLAQVRLSLLVCEGNDGLYVVDQHAADECALYAKLLAQFRAKATPSEALLFPAVVELGPKDLTLVEANLDVFPSLGMDVRIRGKDRVSIHSLPRLLKRATAEELLRDVLGALGHSSGQATEDAVEHALTSMACHGALRNGEVLSATQAQAVVACLDEVIEPVRAKHTRRIVAKLEWSELLRGSNRR